jgi:tRNA threonylcarbamoyladenosine biosynthesis protein TsaE
VTEFDLLHAEILSSDPAETHALGERLGSVAQAGDAFLLEGAFGVGKTVLVQGLAAGLGVPTQVTSPSFVLVHQHQGRLTLFHVDLYRAERLDVELEEAVADALDAGGVTAIEWPGLLPAELRAGATVARFELGPDKSRRIVIETRSARLHAAARAATPPSAGGAERS